MKRSESFNGVDSYENIGGRFVEVPERIKKLKRDGAGFPIPWFVPVIEGAPDFTRIDPDKIRDAVFFKLCYLCGQKLGSHKAFLVGPMCAMSRETVEPPCHVECAIFEAMVCGEHRKFGVALVWSTRSFETHRIGERLQFKMGVADDMAFFVHGRPATGEEIATSIKTGLEAAGKLGPIEQEAVNEMMVGLDALLAERGS